MADSATPSQPTHSILGDDDDDLFDIFGDTSTPITPFRSAQKEIDTESLSPTIKKDSTYVEDNEFLSWLDDSPKKEDSIIIQSAKKDKPAISTDAITSATMDSFFDEVFGDEVSSPPKHASPRNKREADSLTTEIVEIVESSFPDVVQLRKILLRLGYIPAKYRGEIWCILLTGAGTGECEVSLPTSEEEELTRFQQLAADCDAVVNRKFNHYDVESQNSETTSRIRQEMYDILVVFCIRRQVQYNHLYCHLLAPMLALPDPMTKPQALSCFYSFASEFVPLVNLKVNFHIILPFF